MVRAYNLSDLKAYFPAWRPPQTSLFEIAVVSAGGTSTGAYIAGVLDFLIEAFAEWEAFRTTGGLPAYPVQLRNLTGTSAGGLSSALAALMIAKACPPAYPEALWTLIRQQEGLEGPEAVALHRQNPLFSAWVEKVSLDRLLDTRTSTKPSIFYPAPNDIRDEVFRDLAASPLATNRGWVSDPLEIRITAGNLRGIPYALDFNVNPQSGRMENIETYTMHRDHVAFSLDLGAQGGTANRDCAPPDAHELHIVNFPASAEWKLYGEAAVASSSIPLVFPPKTVEQDPRVYDWRSSYFDNITGTRIADASASAAAVPPEPRPIVDLPAWTDGVTPSPIYDYTATDGGVFDDAPFELARTRLAGVKGHNPQDGENVCRVVILIDPLTEDKSRTPDDPKGLFSTLLQLVMSPIEQSRYSATDMAQIKDEGIYSRYMIAPSRGHPELTPVSWGPSLSLMTAPLHAVLGFSCRDYRQHDFFLGRRNAQNFLRRYFVLPADHWLIQSLPKSVWRDGERVTRNGVDHYPILPLRGRAALEQPLPEWPWQALTDSEIDVIGEKFGKRIRLLLGSMVDEFAAPETSGNWLKRFGSRIGSKAAHAAFEAGWMIFGGRAVKAIKTGFRDARDSLNPRTPERINARAAD